jgi:pSer/pThr/pTyr-binding forkhead associated (FHA) protein
MQTSSDQLIAELVFVNGQQSGRRVPVGLNRLIIGREIDCDLQLDDAQVSRHHAALLPDAYGIRVRDLGSLNGTVLNGQRLSGTISLRHGDRLRIGETLLLLHAPSVLGRSEEATHVGLADTQLAQVRTAGQR